MTACTCVNGCAVMPCKCWCHDDTPDEFLAGLRAEPVGWRQSDGSWLCECGSTQPTDMHLYFHRRGGHAEVVHVERVVGP